MAKKTYIRMKDRRTGTSSPARKKRTVTSKGKQYTPEPKPMTGRQRLLKEMYDRYGQEGLDWAEQTVDARKQIIHGLKLQGYPIWEIAHICGVDENTVVRDTKEMRENSKRISTEERIHDLTDRMDTINTRLLEGNLGVPQAKAMAQIVMTQAKLLGMVDSNQLEDAFKNLADIIGKRNSGNSNG